MLPDPHPTPCPALFTFQLLPTPTKLSPKCGPLLCVCVCVCVLFILGGRVDAGKEVEGGGKEFITAASIRQIWQGDLRD